MDVRIAAQQVVAPELARPAAFELSSLRLNLSERRGFRGGRFLGKKMVARK